MNLPALVDAPPAFKDGPVSRKAFDALVLANYDALKPAEQRVVRHIGKNRLAVLSTSAADLARQIGASDATVVRAVKALGFKGLAELRAALAAGLADESNPADNMRRTAADVGEGVERAVAAVIDTHREALREMSEPGVQALIVQAIRVLNGLERVLIFGIGPSASLADYVALLLNRHGRAARAINATGNGLADQLLDVRPGDGLLILAYGRTYAEVLVVFEEASRRRLPVVLVTDSLEPKLARQADVIVPARRGRQGRVAMHGVTLIVLEAIALGLAFADQQAAMGALARVGDVRSRLARHGG